MLSDEFKNRVTFVGYSDVAVRKAFAQSEAIEHAPDIECLENVWAIPGCEALYSYSGERIDSTGRNTVPTGINSIYSQRIADKVFRYSPPSIVPPGDFLTVDRDVLFGGILLDHYGHFLTDSMARLWHRPCLPLMFISRGRTEKILSRGYIRTVFGALGVRHETLLIVDRPTLFRRVIAPKPSIERATRIFTSAQIPHLAVFDKLKPMKKTGRPIYLSRALQRRRNFDRETNADIESYFQVKGFQIVYPETFSLQEQIGLLASSPIIAGTIGSAFHTLLFCPTDTTTRIIYLSTQHLRHRFFLIDAIKEHRPVYINALQVNSNETTPCGIDGPAIKSAIGSIL